MGDVGKRGDVARGSSATKPDSTGLAELLQLREPWRGIRDGELGGTGQGVDVSAPPASSANAEHVGVLLGEDDLRVVRSPPVAPPQESADAVCCNAKSVGEPDASNAPVRFDERR